MAERKPVEKMKYEEAHAEMEAIVASLEAGDLTLEDSTTIFARGQALVKHCMKLLEKAELKVRLLSGEEIEESEDPA